MIATDTPQRMGLLSASVFAFVFLVAAAPTALAAKRMAIVSTQRPGGKDAPVRAKITQKIARALKQHKVQVIAPGRAQKAVAKDDASLAEADWEKLARQLKVDGFVTVALSQVGAKRTADVGIRNGSDGAVAGEHSFVAKGPPKKLIAAVAGGFWKKLGPAVKRTSPPARDGGAGLVAARDPSPSDGESGDADTTNTSDTGLIGGDAPPAKASGERAAAEAEPESEPASTASNKKRADAEAGDGAKDEDEPGGRTKQKQAAARRSDDGDDALPDEKAGRGAPIAGAYALEVELDFRMLRRVFQYAPLSAAAHYPLEFSPTVGGRASYYPIKYAGIFAQGDFSSWLKSGPFPTSTQEIVGGAQARLPFSFGQVSASAAYFRHAFFLIDSPDPNDASRLNFAVPNTVYQGGRFAGAARFKLGRVMQVGVEAAYRLVTGAGQGYGQLKSMSYFPMSQPPIGLDAGGFVGARLFELLEVRAGVDYRRYVFGALRGTTAAGTMIDARGAIDQYVSIYVAVVGVLGGGR